MEKKNYKPKEDKAKHGLMIRAKISHFLAWECEGFTVEKERKEEENKKEEGRREEEENPSLKFLVHVWNSCLKLWFGTSLLFETLLFVSMKPICMDLLVRKPS